MLTYLSVASGIAADTVAFSRLGWRALAYAEVEPFSCALLHHHYGCGRPLHLPRDSEASSKEMRRLVAMARVNAKLPRHEGSTPPNLGDIRQLDARPFHGVDVFIGGTPCQDFSVAGLRAGLSGERSSLFYDYARMADECNPEALVWENVPGVLSDAGNAFGAILSTLVGVVDAVVPGPRPWLGESTEFWRWHRKRRVHIPKWPRAGWVAGPKRTASWRVFDAQYFGVAQRRERLILVACPGGWADPREILFEFGGVRRDTPPRRETSEDLVGAFGSSSYTGGHGGRPEGAAAGHYLAVNTGDRRRDGAVDLARPLLSSPSGFRMDMDSETFVVSRSLCADGKASESAAQQAAHAGLQVPVAHCLRCSGCNAWDETRQTYVVSPALRAEGHDASEDGTGRQPLVITFNGAQDPVESVDVAVPCGRNQGMGTCIAFAERSRSCGRSLETQEDLACALQSPASGGGTYSRRVVARSAVRRLLPVECERLMGLPDGYTDVPFKGRPAADAPRYRAIGNSIPVPLLEWLGRRIEAALTRRRLSQSGVV